MAEEVVVPALREPAAAVVVEGETDREGRAPTDEAPLLGLTAGDEAEDAVANVDEPMKNAPHKDRLRSRQADEGETTHQQNRTRR